LPNKEEWEIDQLILDGIIIKEYSPEYIDKNQSFPPDRESEFIGISIIARTYDHIKDNYG